MKRYMWLGIVVLVVVTAAVSIIALPKGPQWTTSSPEALEAFELAMEAQKKLYHNDVRGHLERALELDPDFVMAKMMMADVYRMEGDKELAQEMIEDALAADPSQLRPRERFFLERSRAFVEERSKDITDITARYLEEFPDDPYILNTAANQAFSRGDNETGERLYRRLLEISPNWVIAYNQLGYITMMQGRFAEAEEYFTSYRFIAPDQANPHDSLGELYIVLGRYPEAAQSIETALDIKPDFWDSYDHLMLVRTLMGDTIGAQEAKADALAAEGCPDWLDSRLGCWEQFFELEQMRAWNEIYDLRESECLNEEYPASYPHIVLHRAASHLGDWETAQELEEAVAAVLEKARSHGESGKFDAITPGFLHMQGVRLALSGDLEAAEKAFNDADSHLTYRDSGLGMFKLYNRLFLVETLLAQGRDADAHKLLARVRAVNPVIVADFEQEGLSEMGLSRG